MFGVWVLGGFQQTLGPYALNPPSPGSPTLLVLGLLGDQGVRLKGKGRTTFGRIWCFRVWGFEKPETRNPKPPRPQKP